ncbi:MAG TPA: hypothetical protein VF627_01240, partial [Abditibacterium sp.]
LVHARVLAAVRAPDLELLCSPSRRRNPAALERLAALLIVEASVAQPLPHSPSRALFEAWPHSQNVLKTLRNDESQPLRARALAALVRGATTPLEALPGEPFLRRAARFGARFGFPRAPQLVLALLQKGGREIEADVLRIEKTLESDSLFGFDIAALMSLHRAEVAAADLANVAETASDFTDPFPSLRFVPVAPKRFDLDAERALCARWNALRVDFCAALRPSLIQVARSGKPRDLELVFELLHHLLTVPLGALGTCKVERNSLPRRSERDLPSFETSCAAALETIRDVVSNAVHSSEPGALLELLIEAAATSEIEGAVANSSSAAWAAKWAEWAKWEAPNRLTVLTRLAEKAGVAAAREALRLDCLRVWKRPRHLDAEMTRLVIEIAAWAPPGASNLVYRFERMHSAWKGASAARTALRPLQRALEDADGDERARWLAEILDSIDSGRGARAELPAMVRLLPLMRRIAGAAGADFPRGDLSDCSVALWRTLPGEAALDARLGWLGSEMERHWHESKREENAAKRALDWTHLAALSGFMSQLCADDEAQFRRAMTACWKFSAQADDVEWDTVSRGAKLAFGFPHLAAALRENVARAPHRCFDLLEKLGPLDRFKALCAPLETRREATEDFDAHWRPILEIDAEFETLALRFTAAKTELSESAAPPAGALKIAAWPQKIDAEIAALQCRSELPPNLAIRLANLVARLEDGAALQASMREELLETLLSATREAELRAAERAVESCYRVRLEALGAPKNAILDANLLNAALFSTDIESNRKWLREIVRAHCDGRVGWGLEIAGNARWLARMSERGLVQTEWLSEAPREFSLGGGRIELRLEACPLQILQMGNLFGTCLSRGGINAHSSVANAVELNKRVVFARDCRGRVVGRQLLAISGEGKLLGFHVYASITEGDADALRAAFLGFAQNLATRCGLEMADRGEVERLFVSDWYDDGSINWLDLQPVAAEKQSGKLES